MIDRITDAGQCDYYEVIIKVIKQGLSDNCLNRCATDLPLIKGRKTIGEFRPQTDQRSDDSNLQHVKGETGRNRYKAVS